MSHKRLSGQRTEAGAPSFVRTGALFQLASLSLLLEDPSQSGKVAIYYNIRNQRDSFAPIQENIKLAYGAADEPDGKMARADMRTKTNVAN